MTSPLFFPQVLNEPGLHQELGKTHSLSDKDFTWLSHIELASDERRQAQTPPMSAEKLLAKVKDKVAVPLAGCFMLSSTPDDAGAILYTPYGGIEKFDDVDSLAAELILRLTRASERDALLRFVSIAQRIELEGETITEVAHEIIKGEVFEDQKTVIQNNLQQNAQRLLEELIQLPALTDLLNEILDDLLGHSFTGLKQRDTRVNFGIDSRVNPALETSMPLSDALLLFYRHQGWPSDQTIVFSHPDRKLAPYDPDQAERDNELWQKAVKTASAGLTRSLGEKLRAYWNHVLPNGQSRRKLFIQAISDKARADILFKRQETIINPEQSRALEVLFDRSTTGTAQTPLAPETVRLWEYTANFVELAGSFMIAYPDAYLFTPASGLQLLDGHDDLQQTVRAKAIAKGHDDELYELMTQEERHRFLGFDEPRVSGEAITGSVFESLFDAIIDKQLQNVEYALGVFRHSDGDVSIQALFDKALDVRSMIDDQLLALPTQGRWSTHQVITGQSRPSIVLADKATTLSKTFDSVRSALDAQWQAQPVETGALQRTYLEAMKPALAHAMSLGIRGEANLRRLNRTLSGVDSAIVDTVLDPNRPTRRQRKALNGFRPDAYWFSLESAGHTSSLAVAHCFMLTERGGLDTQHSGRAILWTPAMGLEAFESVATARTELQRRLLDPLKRLTLLENLLPAEREFHKTYELGNFRPIENNLLLHRQQSSIEHFLAVCDHVRTLKLTGTQQAKALDALKRQPTFTNLQRAKHIGEAIATQQTLPAWLGMASLEEQQKHVEIMEQHRHSLSEGKDYLHGIKTLAVYVHEQLVSLQKTRFQGSFIDPDHVKVTPALAIAGPAQSLTEFALNHVNVLQGTGFSIASTTSKALPSGMDTHAVRQLLLQLNIKSVYEQLLSEQLSGDSDNAKARKLRYFRQLPWHLLQEAHALKLQEQLSQKAFDAIEQLLDMPNATARAAVTGADAIIRPLELMSTARATAVKALGMYLVSPGKSVTGPQVLYAPYFVGLPFTEFETETDLLAALNTPGPLHDLLLRRLPESSRATFQNLLNSTVGETTEITLASNPVTGNMLERLFQDNILLLKQMLGSQSTVTARTDWEKAKELFSSGIKLVSGFLPGKLSCGLFLWRAYKDFKDSAEALQSQHWKSAFKSFVSGAAQMITMGRMMQGNPASTPAALASTELPAEQPAVAPQWSAINTTSASRTTAQAYEAPTVELEKFQTDSTEGTYRDPTTTRHYAPVMGKVYRVAKHGKAWRMTNEKQAGPLLAKAPGPQLVLAADPHAIHYGKAISRFANRITTRFDASATLNIEAQGMDQIRRKYPDRARAIVEAVDLARCYAFNSLHNLSQLRTTGPGTRLDTFLKAFFDVSVIDGAILDKIKAVIVPICNALVDPGLDELDTNRFVVGANTSSTVPVVAFVIESDMQKKVYFTESFFDQQLDSYKFNLTEPFDVDGHARAATLIHEFSHHFAKTIDIAYLESRRPFSDLIATITPFAVTLKKEHEQLQREALSMATPREELFALWNDVMSSWESLDSIPATAHIGKEIKKITGTQSMSDARSAFLDRVKPDLRIDTILRNADSIARLICEMGRQLDPVLVTPTTSP
ncbi:dermonecrotic toxin domain-containing protein [Pseudomonas silesiensis]|uniref:dermonecrotic toxin domain-containing protein n=1 Tax=Pseudomonas silesiensis TaxID=1853130 RepID=UPI0034D760D6